MDPPSAIPPLPIPVSSSRNVVQMYEDLLVANLGAVRSIESGIRNVSWLLPGRFRDAELASEGLFALLNVVSGYHDSLLTKHLDPNLTLPPHPFEPDSEFPTGLSKTTPALPPPSDHARYTKYWSDRSSLYRKASRMLMTIGYVELLIEMLARKRLGDRRRWNYVLGLEGIKTTLRLILLLITRRPVLSSPAPVREFDLVSIPSTVLKSKLSTKLPKTASSDPDIYNPLDEGSRPPHGAITPTMPPYAPLRSHLFPLTTALLDEHLPHPLSLMPKLNASETVAEVIESSVTLIHVLLLLRSSRRRNISYTRDSLPTLSSSLPPYLVPLLLSLFARYLRSPPHSILQAEHYGSLDRRLAMRAFLTGPMWIGWTRPKIMGLVSALRKVPLVNIAGEFVEGYVPLVDEYFYYSS